MTAHDYPDELRDAALHWLLETDPGAKADGVRLLADSWRMGNVLLDADAELQAQGPIPGRPERPKLVPPREVPHRSMRTVEGRAALVHALAHIEFNAINLALDAIWRFSGMPSEYYADWLQVAAEEALHRGDEARREAGPILARIRPGKFGEDRSARPYHAIGIGRGADMFGPQIDLEAEKTAALVGR